MSQIEGVGSHLVWASYEGTVTAGVSRTTDDQITDADVRAIEARTDLFSGVTPLVELHGTVSVLSRAADLSVLGTTPNYATVRKNLRILRGRFLDDDDISERAKVCVVNHALYDELFGKRRVAGEDDPHARHDLPGHRRVRQARGHDGSGRGHPVVDPHPGHRRLVLHAHAPRGHGLRRGARVLRDPARRRDRREILRDRHHQGSVFKVKTMTTVIRVARAISFGLIVVFIAAAAVSVVVGGVGIMNILLASVEQRTREIGVRMSVGARRRDILRQFLLEALMLGVMGALDRRRRGSGARRSLVSSFVHEVPVRVSPLSALLAFLFSCGVTVVFGVVPAYRAANLNPTEALRHE